MKLCAHVSAAPLVINKRANIILFSSTMKSCLLAIVNSLTACQNQSKSCLSYSSGLAIWTFLVLMRVVGAVAVAVAGRF